MALSKINFTLLEWLSITGLAQCVVILVYMLFRMKSWKDVFLPTTYFILLGLGFFLQFSLRIEDIASEVRYALWFITTGQFAISYLLILQVAHLNKFPALKHFNIFLLIPLSWGVLLLLDRSVSFCKVGMVCEKGLVWLNLASGILGAVCLLALWFSKGLFSDIPSSKNGKERYWLILTLILLNTLLIGTCISYTVGDISLEDTDILKIAFGLGFAYLTSTVLFRIYPSPIETQKKPNALQNLNDQEKEIADKIHKLMIYDKLYHEPSFKRSDLARELKLSEGLVSKVINNAFGKTLPQMLNEYRVEDAKRLLQDPNIAIKTVASEVGFNSLATFNRMFREITGETPSIYRNKQDIQIH